MRVTGLRERPGGLVEVEVDGGAWRAFPAAAVVRAGLLPGVTLDRPRLRSLARERRRSEALATAGRILSRREHSSAALADRLERRGFPAEPRGEALAAARRAGLLDDRRLAFRRAEALARRDRGDEAIRWQLEGEGLPSEFVAEAIAALPPQADRAAAVVLRRGIGPRTARYLAARGFPAELATTALGDEGAAG